ncbi:Maf family protein [Halioglobus pacificus]|uniref:dTTP/UTP pyrophosphatase n=1 Tax=Parahalioglobus pacificus TaxID=930806 RepID=A0A918XC34_9GAMM|nr:nucleoside triphosphate pyrophosphatase [Halioglobus pacificus]NQY02142.1 septum formation inhibitor Maf [Halieaceae bacterium]GHD25752.1 Maf-like protein YhdE [Halioglobus pacificus]
MTQLILASASPRRHALLTQLGVSFSVQSADIDETPMPAEAAREYVERIASEKAKTVAAFYPNCAVLAADTSVVVDGDILGKPADARAGLAMLARLSGRTHQVMTGICLIANSSSIVESVITDVTFAGLDRATCEAYLATDEPYDKAGGYGIQGLGGAFVTSIQGSYSNVVGLPLHETWALLTAQGIPSHLTTGDLRNE